MEDSKPGSSSLVPEEMKDKIFKCKSVAVYEKWHEKFINFISENNHPETLKSVLLFFNHISKFYAPSTLWQAYSCLNKYYSTYKSWKSFNDTSLLKNFLKKIEKDSATVKKQSLILAKEELHDFFQKRTKRREKVSCKKSGGDHWLFWRLAMCRVGSFKF